MNVNKIESLKDLNLWDHQTEAVKCICDYFKSGESEFGLIKMPTGTGKTKIIGTVSQFYSEIKTTLIVCPSEYLTKQIRKDVSTNFWNETDVEKDTISMKSASVFLPSTLGNILDKIGTEDAILVCTTQTLEALNSKNKALYSRLKGKISLILVDEGHREPAPKWSSAISSLKKPTVLFSATPYRNDFRLFNIHKDYVFRFSFQEAEDKNIVRKVNFEVGKFEKSHNAFVENLLKFYKGKFKRKNHTYKDNHRVIIRCSSAKDIMEIRSILKSIGISSISIHEEFKNNKTEGLYNSVPDPQITDGDFWIHQNKLNEGFDDSRFSLLAIFQPDGNTRALVQQIGRIIRNPKLLGGQIAYVYSHEDYRLKGKWQTYLRYEEKTKDNFQIANPENIINDLTELQEEYSYLT